MDRPLDIWWIVWKRINLPWKSYKKRIINFYFCILSSFCFGFLFKLKPNSRIRLSEDWDCQTILYFSLENDLTIFFVVRLFKSKWIGHRLTQYISKWIRKNYNWNFNILNRFFLATSVCELMYWTFYNVLPQFSAMPDGGIHRQITQNWRNSVTTWRWKMWRYRQKCYKSL